MTITASMSIQGNTKKAAEAAAKQEKQKNHKTAAYIPGHPATFESGQGMAGVLRGIVIKIVYNNFPWPTPSEAQKQKIEYTAQGILDARALYPDSSLADLYDPLTMPPELRKAHAANDIAVMQAYGFSTRMSESDCVAELMKMYEKLVSSEQKQ